VLDLHALRHTTGTMLAAAGVHPRVAQSLLRQSTAELTLALYAHPYAGQQVDGVEAVPKFGAEGERGQHGTRGLPMGLRNDGVRLQS